MCDTPEFDNDDLNRITIGGESMKTHTEVRKSENRNDKIALQSFSNQGTINANFKNAIIKANNAVNGP